MGLRHTHKANSPASMGAELALCTQRPRRALSPSDVHRAAGRAGVLHPPRHRTPRPGPTSMGRFIGAGGRAQSRGNRRGWGPTIEAALSAIVSLAHS